jgi:hypothetical protein
LALRPARIEVVIDELALGGVSSRDPRVAQAVAQATRRALADRPAAKHADHPAIGRAVGDAVAARTAR